MTTRGEATSETKNLAELALHNKTPIAVAIAEYVGSLIHKNPDTPYVFGKVKKETNAQVGGVLIGEQPSQQAVPSGLPMAQIGSIGVGKHTGTNDGRHDLAA